MADPGEGTAPRRRRQPPPPFRPVAVRRVEHPARWLARVTLGGPALVGFEVGEPAASVRLLLPGPGASALELPVWNGNEFLDAQGRRPLIRTMTPRRVDPGAGELDVEVVLHGSGAASGWAAGAAPGMPAAVSGPGRGYAIDPLAAAYVLAGDRSAVPAISQLLEALPPAVEVTVHAELAPGDLPLQLPAHPAARIHWYTTAPGEAPGGQLLDALRREPLGEGVRLWVGGEAAAMQRIRRLVFDEGRILRSATSIRGYWKWGRTGESPADGEP